jgi:hypothetical protein
MCAPRSRAGGQTQPKGFIVDPEITVADRQLWVANKTESEATSTASQPPKTHHFVVYGRASRDDAAAFAAAKVFLESAIDAAPGETGGRPPKGGPMAGVHGRHYVIRFPTKAEIAARVIDLDRDFSDAYGAGPEFELTMCLAPKQSSNMLAAVGYKDRPRRSILHFSAVNRSIIHCIRGRRQSPAMQWKTDRETDVSTKHEDGAL